MAISKVTLPDGSLLLLKSNINEEEIQLEKLLRIDVANLAAELVTIPIILNHFGIMLADVTNMYNESKLSVNTHEAKCRERIITEHIDEKKKKPTVEDLKALIDSDKGFQATKKLMYRRQKEMEYVSSVYWSLKSKDDKLNKLSMSIQAGDIEQQLVETQIKRINCVDIKVVR